MVSINDVDLGATEEKEQSLLRLRSVLQRVAYCFVLVSGARKVRSAAAFCMTSPT